MMQFTGFGLYAQRAVNGLWGAATLVLAAGWLARRTSPTWAVGFAAILALSGPWMAFIHLGKTYAFTGLTAMATLWVYTEWPHGRRRLSLIALLGTLGVGCRLPAAPFFAVIWVAAFLDGPAMPWADRIKAVAWSLLWPAVIVLPFYLVAPASARFWTFDFHRMSVPNKHWELSWTEIVALAPVLWFGVAAGLAHAAMARKAPAGKEIGIIVATLLALALNLLPAGVYEEYGVPFLPLLAMGAALGFWRMGADMIWLRHGATPLLLLLANVVLAVGLLWSKMPPGRHNSLSCLLPLNSLDYDQALPARLGQLRQVVSRYLPADKPFIGSQIILAVETGRFVPRNLRMGPYTATADFSPTEALALNLITFPELEAWFNDPAVPLLAFWKVGNLNYAWSMPSFRNPPERNRKRWLDIFRRDFYVAYEDQDFFLLVRKSALIP
jgi:4-amino-4-deoxy-L-arabinose transferase-like glycosyltransferase